MIIDLHNHTRASHDGFTSSSQLLRACVVRAINMVAVTEHDLACIVDPRPFEAHGIVLIPGCEYTTEAGAHVIGLFVTDPLPEGSTRQEIIKHIQSSDGLIVMSHPFNPGSGYLEIHGE